MVLNAVPFDVGAPFFITLYFNHKVLYAPSDYENEDNFVDLIRERPSTSRIQKLVDEEKEDEESNEDAADVENAQGEKNPEPVTEKTLDSLHSTTIDPSKKESSHIHKRLMYEEVALSKIIREYPGKLLRNVEIGSENLYPFDGAIIQDSKSLVLVEVKLIHSFPQMRSYIKKSLPKINSALAEFKLKVPAHKSVLFVVVIIDAMKDVENSDTAIEKIFRKKLEDFNVNYAVQVYKESAINESLVDFGKRHA